MPQIPFFCIPASISEPCAKPRASCWADSHINFLPQVAPHGSTQSAYSHVFILLTAQTSLPRSMQLTRQLSSLLLNFISSTISISGPLVISRISHQGACFNTMHVVSRRKLFGNFVPDMQRVSNLISSRDLLTHKTRFSKLIRRWI